MMERKLFDSTFVTERPHSIKEVDLRRSRTQKILRLLIQDIYRSNYSEIPDKHFEFLGFKYKKVEIIGTVIEIVHPATPKIIYKIEDGTGIITCFLKIIEDDFRLSELKKELNKLPSDLNDEQKVKYVISSASARFLNRLQKQNISLGTNVRATGLVYEFSDDRVIFLDYIHVVNNIAIARNALVNIYTNFYFKYL